MPRLLQADENRYGIILSLPAGEEIRYKYTLGDGFWNAEHTADGSFNIRRIIVPNHPIQINDEVATWNDGNKASITFDLWTPDNSPIGEEVTIQFNPYGWTTPLPMTEIAPNHWVFILFSPFDIISNLTYRYCREGECGIADDDATLGDSPQGRSVSPSFEPQYIADTVNSWAWFIEDLQVEPVPPPSVTARSEEFLSAIELMPGNKAASTVHIHSSISDVTNTNANWIIFTPTWTFTHQIPPVIEPNPNQDPLWFDLTSLSNEAISMGLQVGLHPQIHFPDSPEEWWLTVPLDFSWWNSWFDQYANFVIHFAETAEKQGIDMIVLGGEWLTPALPGGKLANGEPSGVPADAELRWEEILAEVDSRFSGTIAWSMSLPTSDRMPTYFQYIDQIQLNWLPQLQPDSSIEDLQNQALDSLNGDTNDFWSSWLKPSNKILVLRIAYPSVTGWDSTCTEENQELCLSLDDFSKPAPNIPDMPIDMGHQAVIYSSLLSAVSEKNWISGIISWGYYSPVVLHDQSISIHGKPAEEILEFWFAEIRK
jgi:hypothetical protein